MAEAAEAFRTFALEPPYQVRTLRKSLVDRIGDLAQQLADGYAQDWGDYKYRAGHIAGLKEAIGLCEEMEKQESK